MNDLMDKIYDCCDLFADVVRASERGVTAVPANRKRVKFGLKTLEIESDIKEKDDLIKDLAERLNTALCWIPDEDWNNDCDESAVLCGKILDGEEHE